MKKTASLLILLFALTCASFAQNTAPPPGYDGGDYTATERAYGQVALAIWRGWYQWFWGVPGDCGL